MKRKTGDEFEQDPSWNRLKVLGQGHGWNQRHRWKGWSWTGVEASYLLSLACVCVVGGRAKGGPESSSIYCQLSESLQLVNCISC